MPSADLQELVRDRTESKHDDEFVVCSNCGAIIGYVADAIEVDGQHTHVRVNPLGLEFVFECFGEALGCTILGQPQHADTWFAGYMWEIAKCSGCDEHLGWLFTAQDHFYGLISSRIEIRKQ